MTKRLFGLIFTLPGLLLRSPLFLAIAVAVEVSSPGPVMFRTLGKIVA